MSITATTMSLLAVMTLLGFALTYAKLLGVVPDSVLLQPSRARRARFHSHLPLILFNLSVMFVGSGLTLWYVEHIFSTEPVSPLIVVAQLALVFAVDDLWVYCWHRYMHENTWLYRKVHRIHHRAYAPLPIEYIYVHPVEWLVGTVGPVVGLCGVMFAFGSIHLWSLWGFVFLRQLHELNVHSGIRSVLSTRLPPLGTTEHHELHHARPTLGNYGSIMTLWDRLFGTRSTQALPRPTPGAAK